MSFPLSSATSRSLPMRLRSLPTPEDIGKSHNHLLTVKTAAIQMRDAVERRWNCVLLDLLVRILLLFPAYDRVDFCKGRLGCVAAAKEKQVSEHRDFVVNSVHHRADVGAGPVVVAENDARIVAHVRRR